VSPEGGEGRVGPALLVALLVAALVTGVLVYHARTADLALEVPQIERMLGDGGDAEIPVELEFFVRFDEPHARVEIVGSGDMPVRTFAADVALEAEERIGCRWDGRDDQGDPVAPGNYRLRVLLPDQDRDMVFPQRIAVRRPPPDGAVAIADECEREATGEVLG
jgi:hypothetical protein